METKLEMVVTGYRLPYWEIFGEYWDLANQSQMYKVGDFPQDRANSKIKSLAQVSRYVCLR